MEDTRSQLEEKLEALETQVADTVQTTTEAVTETVEAVKDTVEKASETVGDVTDAVKETVATVGETFNLWTQADRHPWVVFGGSVLLGYLGAQLVGRSNGRTEEVREEPRAQGPPSWASAQEGPSRERWQSEAPAPPQPRAEQPSRQEKSWLWDELGRLKGLAVGALMGVVRDLAKQAVPEAVGNRVAEEVDNITNHLGGEPVQGQVLPNSTAKS